MCRRAVAAPTAGELRGHHNLRPRCATGTFVMLALEGLNLGGPMPAAVAAGESVMPAASKYSAQNRLTRTRRLATRDSVGRGSMASRRSGGGRAGVPVRRADGIAEFRPIRGTARRIRHSHHGDPPRDLWE